MVKKAPTLSNRSLLLQRALYNFRDELKLKGMEDLAQHLEDGAFEMDLTWVNARDVSKKIFEIWKTQ